jgi:hypothetical protein
MGELELRITFSGSHGGHWVASWVQNDAVLFETTGTSIEAALAALVAEIGEELANVTGGVEKEEEEV